MCTALPLDQIYPAIKFHNPSWYSLGDMHHTKFKFEKKKEKRATTQKLNMQELQFICTTLPLDEMYPHMKFQNRR